MKTNNPDFGCYQLLIRLHKERKIIVGALGEILFPEGYYIYTGRAARGLRRRVQRHLGINKKRHWHIDYLLEKGNIVEVFYYPGRLDECKINMAGLKAHDNAEVVKYFGSSDCRCPGHLIRITRMPEL